MVYRLEVYVDDLAVFKNDIEFIKVRRQTNWLGNYVNEFSKDGISMLKVVKKGFFETNSIDIVHQELDKQVRFERQKEGFFVLKFDNSTLSVTNPTHNKKQTISHLLKDGIIYGEVTTERKWIKLNPIVYDIQFQNDDPFNEYFIFLFAITLEMSA
jgi:hypothetical protein